MNPKTLIRMLLESSGHADQNVAKFLARDSDALIDAMREGKIQNFLGSSADGRALLNNAEFMRMTNKVSGNLDYITRAGQDLASGRRVNATEFLNRMDIPANGNVGTALTQSISDFNGLAARGASTSTNNADAIAAARERLARPARPRDVSADEVAERLARARTGADDAARVAAEAPTPKPAIQAADNAAGAADEAARRAAMPKVSWSDAKSFRALENAQSSYGTKIQDLLARNVTPEEHDKWIKQFQINARRGGIEAHSLDTIRNLGRQSRLSNEVVGEFERISALQANKGLTSYLPQKLDSLSATFQNATMHPFRSAGSLYVQSLTAPLVLGGRTLGWAMQNKGLALASSVTGFGAITAIDMQTDKAASTAIRNLATEGTQSWANWAAWNATGVITGAGWLYGQVDKDAAKEWTDSAIDGTVGVMRNMPGTAANVFGVSEDQINIASSIPVVNIPLRGINAAGLMADAVELTQGDETSTDITVPTATATTPDADTQVNDGTQATESRIPESVRNAGQRVTEGADNLASQAALANALRNPGKAWQHLQEAAQNNPTIQKIVEVGDQHPFLKWGMIGGFAFGALSDGSAGERISRGIRNALIMGALMDFVGAALLNRPSGIARMFNQMRANPTPDGVVHQAPSTVVEPAAPAAETTAPQNTTQPAATPAELRTQFQAQAAPIATPAPDPNSTAFAFRNAAAQPDTARPAVFINPDMPASNDPHYRREMPVSPTMMSMGG